MIIVIMITMKNSYDDNEFNDNNNYVNDGNVSDNDDDEQVHNDNDSGN